jgi:hypothetical protein
MGLSLSHLKAHRLCLWRAHQSLPMGGVIRQALPIAPMKVRGQPVTIVRRELADGRVEITMSEADKEFLLAYQYQEKHGLSTTRAAVRARLKTWRRMRERIEQEGAIGLDIPFEGRVPE